MSKKKILWNVQFEKEMPARFADAFLKILINKLQECMLIVLENLKSTQQILGTLNKIIIKPQ